MYEIDFLGRHTAPKNFFLIFFRSTMVQLAYDASNLRRLRALKAPNQQFYQILGEDILKYIVDNLTIRDTRFFAGVSRCGRVLAWERLRAETIIANETYLSEEDIEFICKLPDEVKYLMYRNKIHTINHDSLIMSIRLHPLDTTVFSHQWFPNYSWPRIERRFFITSLYPSIWHSMTVSKVRMKLSVHGHKVGVALSLLIYDNTVNTLTSVYEQRFALSGVYDRNIHMIPEIKHIIPEIKTVNSFALTPKAIHLKQEYMCMKTMYKNYMKNTPKKWQKRLK